MKTKQIAALLTLLSLLLILAFSLSSLTPAAVAAGATSSQTCKFNASTIPTALKNYNQLYAQKHKPTAKKQAKAKLRPDVARKILFVAWKSFGTSNKLASSASSRNLKQANQESGLQGNIIQQPLGLNVGRNRAGGLFQVLPTTFASWKVPGFNNRFAPLSNALAVVNAQVNSQMSILDGSSGWAPGPGSNPCR